MAHELGGWAAAADDLARIDRRPTGAIEARLAAAVHELQWGTDHHPLTRRRVAGLAVRDALALYLLAGGDGDHLAGLVRLLGIVGDGHPTVGTLADRAGVARALVGAASTPGIDPDRVADYHRLAAALDRPDPHGWHVHAGPDYFTERPDVVRDVARRIGVTLDPLPAHA